MLRSHRGDPRGTTRKHCLGLCLPGVGKEEAEEIGLGGRGPRGLGGSSGKGRGTAPGWVASSSAPRGCPFPAEVPGWLGLCSHTQGPLLCVAWKKMGMCTHPLIRRWPLVQPGRGVL